MTNSYIQAVLQEARNGGVTIDMSKESIVQNLDEWLFPRWPERTEVVTDERLEAALVVFLRTYKKAIAQEDLYVGIWKKDSKYYLDLNVHIPHFDDAIRLAKRYSQEGGRQIMSAFNPARNETRYFS